MLKDIAETINGGVKLAASLLQVALVGGGIVIGYKVYRAASDFLSKPIALPSINMPELPEIKLPGFGPKPVDPLDGIWHFDGPAAPGGHVAPETDPKKMSV